MQPLPALWRGCERQIAVLPNECGRLAKERQVMGSLAHAFSTALSVGPNPFFLSPWICTEARRNLATCSANQGSRKRRFGPTRRASGWMYVGHTGCD
jgi:hypothetical protein